MAVISMFYGIIISIYFFDNRKHHIPHIHVKYGEDEVVISIEENKILEGSIPSTKMKLLLAWMEIHRDELKANWELAVNGESIFKIDPLK